ncbi:MAG: hypothetical protein MMC23_001239 [Stictis urceolatum]|nr:hypothetical protein [Stictis urceolata]
MVAGSRAPSDRALDLDEIAYGQQIPATFLVRSDHNSQAGYDVHESYEPYNPRSPQRQQQHTSSRPPTRPSSSSGSVHTLRRTPNFDQPPRRRAASVGPAPGRRNPQEPYIQAAEAARQQALLPFSDDGETSTTATTPGPQAAPTSSWWPRRTLHISERTASAILYVLEEAIRTPFPFTSDSAEENASMSALGGGTRAQNGNPQRVTTPTEILKRRRDREADREARDREARLADLMKQEQEEEDERRRVEDQRRLSAERRAAGVAGTGGVGFGEPGSRRSGGQRRSTGDVQEVPDTGERRRTDKVLSGGGNPRLPPSTGAPPSYIPTGSRPPDSSSLPIAASRNRGASASQAQTRPSQPAQASRAASLGQQEQSQTRLTSGQPATGTNRAQGGQSAATSFQKQQPSQPTPAAKNGNVLSFPHAFERWEQLSSHWEGLTNYWIKRLDGNSDELKGQHINQQLARQVTDLSAAGANLFHAVVELQRLRASSERKFQRWFFETRNDQEKSQERIAQLERELREEKQARAADAEGGAQRGADRAQLEEALRVRRQAENMVREKERELQISRDEARRGWEEIGRMEQAERDRTFSLKRGQPTLVGGVQVVPMPQAQAMSRQTSSSREQPGGLSSHPVASSSQAGDEGYAYSAARSDTDTDPFTESARDRDTSIPPVPRVPDAGTYQTSNSSSAALQARTATSGPQSSSSYEHPATRVPTTSATEAPMPPQPPTAGFYQHHGPVTTLHEPDAPPRVPSAGAHSHPYSHSVDDTISEEEYEIDEHGHIRRDAQGNPILYRRGPASEDSDEYNVDEQLRRERMYGQQYGGGAPVTNGQGGYSSAPDYSGSGYGWEAVPRHHHPTRLSDVLEEDERSRTSPSRASERSRGVF